MLLPLVLRGLMGLPAPPLPLYEVLVRAGDLHSSPAGVRTGSDRPRVSGGSLLGVLLRPRTAVEGEVELRTCLVRGTQARRWPVVLERSAEGAFFLQGYAEQLLAVTPGDWELVFLVGRPGRLPPCEDALRASAPAGVAPWQVLRQGIEVAGPPPGASD